MVSNPNGVRLRQLECNHRKRVGRSGEALDDDIGISLHGASRPGFNAGPTVMLQAPITLPSCKWEIQTRILSDYGLSSVSNPVLPYVENPCSPHEGKSSLGHGLSLSRYCASVPGGAAPAALLSVHRAIGSLDLSLFSSHKSLPPLQASVGALRRRLEQRS